MAFRSLHLPLTAEQLRPLAPGEHLIQFSQGLTDEEYRSVARLLADRPDVMLRAFGGYGRTIPDLEFLRFFPMVRRVSVDALWGVLQSVDGLGHLSDELEDLGIGALKPPFDLRRIERFRHLRVLRLEGPIRHAEVLSTLTGLESLLLRSVRLPDLSPLLPLENLRRLDLKLGGTPDVALLPRIGRLEELEIWRVRGLSDLTSIADLPHLRTLHLEALPQATALPSLARLTHLRHVTLQSMHGITDLSPVAAAPALESLSLIQMEHLEPDDLRPLAGHPTLRRAHWNIGSLRKTYEAHDVLPLPPEPYGYDQWRAGVPYPDIRRAFSAALRIGLVERDGRMVVREGAGGRAIAADERTAGGERAAPDEPTAAGEPMPGGDVAAEPPTGLG